MARRTLLRMAAATLVATTLVGLAACSDSKDDSASTTSSTAATTSTTAATTSTTTQATGTPATTQPASGKGCPATPATGVPAGLAHRVVSDLDGDGKADTLYVGFADDGVRRFGVATASGARSEWTIPNASPVDPSIYGVADADQDGRPEIFVNPGRIAYVLVLDGCKLQPYLNKDGDPYGFSTGFGAVGTGIGCIDANGDGHRDLVGLDRKDDGDKVTWSRTIVTLKGVQARNGAKTTGTYTHPADDKAIALLNQVTCGDDAFTTPLTANPG